MAIDLEYIENITFLGDMKIIINTVKQVFFHEKGIEGGTVNEVEITDDLGDYLLKAGRISKEEYDKKQAESGLPKYMPNKERRFIFQKFARRK